MDGNKSSRPSNGSLEHSLQAKKSRGPFHPLGSMNVRKNDFGHSPIFSNRLRCTIPLCKETMWHVVL